jgi:hypothetical protein
LPEGGKAILPWRASVEANSLRLSANWFAGRFDVGRGHDGTTTPSRISCNFPAASVMVMVIVAGMRAQSALQMKGLIA